MNRAYRARRDRGAALVEFVLVLPVFLLIVFAAIDWGWYFVRRETAVNAVREGARVASVEPFLTDARTTQQRGFADGEAAIDRYLQFTQARGGTRVCGPTTVAIGGANAVAVQCDITGYPTGPLTGLAFTLVPRTVDVRAVMRFEIQ
jgi:Flp pilus assembly protein TadG